ncbi:MAG TPA: helix-turn-helix transcriptional regulator [Rugosimonospora sp.]|nr:helix-turn-helix transcriptional regulator [Rugosimonospora sp.]
MPTSRTEQLATVRAWAKTGRARTIRIAAGVSLAEMAADLGITAAGLSRWERGERRCTGEPAIRWAGLLARLERDLARPRPEPVLATAGPPGDAAA